MSTKKQEETYIKLGQQLEAAFDSVNPDRKAVYRTALLKGVAAGVGGVIGATIVIALVIWILSLLNNIPLIGPFVDTARETLQEREK